LNKKLAMQLSNSGKKAIISTFNWQKISGQYMDLFESEAQP
jgi:glycosyltransferase involved in cell wall biosynthesis